MSEPVLLAAATAVALHFALPPWDLSFLGWLAPAPLFLAVRRSRSRLAAFGACFAAGWLFWALHVRWLITLSGVNELNWGLSMLFLAVCFGLLGPLAFQARGARAGVGWIVCAAAWVLIEWLRLHLGFAATPWGVLAYSQVGALPVSQLASVAGLWGVSFVLAGVAAGVAFAIDTRLRGEALTGRSGLELLLPLALAALCIGWGALRLEQVSRAPTLRVATLQAGVYARGLDPSSRRHEVLRAYSDLTLAAAGEDPDLIVWPASSAPGVIPWDRFLVGRLEALAGVARTPLLVGSAAQDKSAPRRRERPTANSAFLVAPPGAIVAQYDKIQLLPFNEYVPLRGLVRWPTWLTGELLDMRRGDERTVFELTEGRFGVSICWENLFPRGFRKTVAEGVDFMVSMTNEAFTDRVGAHQQMLAMNVFRAIENGVSVVRAATTGISAVIDSHGRVTARVEDESGRALGATAYQLAEVPVAASRTPYTRLGDWFVLACLVAIPTLGRPPESSSARS